MLSKGAKITNAVVGLLLLGAVAWLAFDIGGVKGGAFATALLGYEGWTLVNKFPGDTISESVWRFARRPLVPLCFGGVVGYLVGAGTLSDPILLLAIGLLLGHFFFGRGTAEEQAMGLDDATRKKNLESELLQAEAALAELGEAFAKMGGKK